jgi:SAM-dependent methyltransferase
MSTGKIQIYTSKGPAVINYSNFEHLTEMLRTQKKQIFARPSIDFYYDQYWERLASMNIFEIPNNAKVLDVGCGSSIMDFILYQYATNPTIYLLDRDDIQYNRPIWADTAEKYPFYHSWSVVNDAIDTSGFNRDNFKFLDPADEWPQDLDLIVSYASWGWHYPFSTYWEQAKQSLKVGGKLSIDLSDTANNVNLPTVIEMVSEEFQNTPVMVRGSKVGKSPQHHTTGRRVVWTRNR